MKTMKKQHGIFVGIILVGVCLWWWIGRNKPTPPRESVDNAPVEAEQQAQPPQSKGPAATQRQNTQQAPTARAQTSAVPELDYAQTALAAQEAHRKELEERWNAQWSTPISFYGKVVDEHEAPVAGASVVFEWAAIQGDSQTAAAISDGLGLFSLTGIKGRSLNVRVSKEGYTLTRSNQITFLYADMTGRGTFTPDAANPVLFHLRKRGPGTDLITSQHGVKDYLGVSVPLDGSPVQVDLLERKAGQGALKLSQTKPAYENWTQAAEWAFRMEIPAGGFVERKDESGFEAPETGYESVVQFNFQRGQANWTTNLRKDYYIKFGDPPRYGRLHLETSLMMSGARLTYAINPDGLRNLEPK